MIKKKRSWEGKGREGKGRNGKGREGRNWRGLKRKKKEIRKEGRKGGIKEGRKKRSSNAGQALQRSRGLLLKNEMIVV